MRKLLIFLIFITTSSLYAQITGTIWGAVTDNTGAPIAGAAVYIENTSLGAQTNFDGTYRIENITPGSYNLTVRFIGYAAQTKYNILVKSAGNSATNFILVEAAEELNEIIVSNANRISRPKETPLSTQTLSAVEIATYPGSNNDVVQVAQTLPGVSPSIGGFRNDLIIRGGAPNETVYYLDGMEVPNINHFSTQGSAGGPVGMVNVSFIDNVTLSTSAFGVQYDNPLSGVLQFSQRKGNARKFGANFRVSASETAFTAEGPLFKNGKESSKTTFLASVRRSYLQFLFKAIGLPFRPNYWDYQYKINHTIDAYNDLSFIGIGSIDDFSAEAPEDATLEQQAQLEQAPFIVQRTNAVGVTWKKRFKNSSGFMTTTLSNNTLQNDFTRYSDPENEVGVLFNNDATESETKLRYQVSQFSGTYKFTGGFNVQHSYYENTTTNAQQNTAFYTEIDFIKYGVFANATASYLNNALDVSIGFRVDDDSFTNNNTILDTFSPRASASYEFTKNWRVTAAIGRYFKIPPYTILGYRDEANILVNQNANYTKSDHAVLGLQHYLNPSASISLEGFYKKYSDYPVSIADGVSLANKGAGFEILGSEAIATTGKGRSYGAELQFQQKLLNNFYGIFAYTWFYSEFTGLNTNQFIPSVWDSRHLVSFTGGYKLPRNWEASARYRFAGNTPFAPTNITATENTYPEIILDYSRLGEEKLDTFSQLDIRIDKKWNFKNLSLNLFLEAQNVTKSTSPEPPSYGLARNTNGAPLSPRSLQQVPTSEGAIIPSIGVVIDF